MFSKSAKLFAFYFNLILGKYLLLGLLILITII